MEKRFRISLDFKVTVNGITKEAAERELKTYSNYAELIKRPQTWEAVERQKRLLQAVLNNKNVLNDYLAHIVAVELESADEILGALDVELDEDKILKPAIDGLGKQDATFFREVIKEELFSENAMHFYQSFKVELEKAKLAEL
jgi:hypothetical protein